MSSEVTPPDADTREKPQPLVRGESLLETTRGYGPEKRKRKLDGVQGKRGKVGKDIRSVLARAGERLDAPGSWTMERALAAFKTCTWCSASDEGEGEIFLTPAPGIVLHDAREDGGAFASPPGQGQYVRVADIRGVSGADQSLTVRTAMGTLTLERAKPTI